MSLRARSGTWHYRFMVNGHEYTDNTGLAATERLRKKAEEVESKARALVKSGRAEELRIAVVPFNKAVVEYLLWDKGEHRDKHATHQYHKTKLTSCVVFFGRKPVSSIRSGDLEDYKTWRRNGDEEKGIAPVAEVTLRHNLHCLSKFFQYGVRKLWCSENPVKGVEIPSDAEAQRDCIFTEEHEALYFDALRSRIKFWGVARLMVLMGLRDSEAVWLRKADIDPIGRKLRIRDSKTKSGHRTLPLTDAAFATCQMFLADGEQSQWLFPSDKKPGSPVSISGLGAAHAYVMEKTKLTGYVPYDLRHTFATRAARSGMPITTLAKWLGHANLKCVMRYVHPNEKDFEQGAQLLNSPSGFGPTIRTEDGQTGGSRAETGDIGVGFKC